MGDSLNDALYQITGTKDTIAAMQEDVKKETTSTPVNLEGAGDSKLSEIRNSIGNLKAELDKIESLFENLEEAIKGD